MSVTVKPWKGHQKWIVRVYVLWSSGNFTRKRKVVSRPTEAQARRYGEELERLILAKGEKAILAEKTESSAPSITVTDWYKLYYAAAELGTVGRKNRGKPQKAVGNRRRRFRMWVEPHLGHRAMRDVTDAHLRDLVNILDELVRTRIRFYEEGENGVREERGGKKYKAGLSGKSASHVWCEVTSGFREAVSSKLNELRILTADPSRGVQPPITTEQREQEALFPSEVIQLLACEAIPLHRRRCYAVAIYTGLRLSELERLAVEDVDLEHDRITVRGLKSTAARRQVPIEKNLRPLLVLVCKARRSGPLLDVPTGSGEFGAAARMRSDLAVAGLTRPDLTRDDDAMMPFTFHGLRHTCITHWAVAGRDQLFLLTCAGHMNVAMTRRYLGKAASASSKFGTPHPPLPASVMGGATVISIGSKRTA